MPRSRKFPVLALPFTTFFLLCNRKKKKLQVALGYKAAPTDITYKLYVLREELTNRHLLSLNNFIKYNTLNLTALLNGCYNVLVTSHTCNLTLLLCSHNGDYYGLGNKKAIQNFGVCHMNVISTSCQISTVFLTNVSRSEVFLFKSAVTIFQYYITVLKSVSVI